MDHRKRKGCGLYRFLLMALPMILLLWAGNKFVRPQALQAESGSSLLGGATGMVRLGTGQPLEGIMVQLISLKNSIRTTVYSDDAGHYEFPKLPAGLYTLRISRPLEFRPYQKDSVEISGAPQLENIVLERVSDTQFLPPTPEILPQLTDAEWLWNLPGTGEEKKTFIFSCAHGCHSLERVWRSRFDERSWDLIVDRMLDYPGGRLLLKRSESEVTENQEVRKQLVEWLAKVRGPGATNPPMQVFQGPRGAATRVIVTEYELPSADERPHDVTGDSKGYIWYTPNLQPYVGRLDPRTGVVKKYPIPRTPGKHSGSHWIKVDKNGIVWFSQTWAQKIVKLDPNTGETQVMDSPFSTGGNMSMTPDGTLWRANGGSKITQFDPESGKVVKQYPLKTALAAYGAETSADGKFFAGGTPWQKNFDGVVFLNIPKGEVVEGQTRSGAADPSRGGFDPEDNAWIGGRQGVLVELENRTHRVKEFIPPTPYVAMYEATPDKHGEVWAGLMGGGRMGRYNPRTEHWTEYVLPEPYSMDFKTWVDNSTDPVTVWYGDYNGYIVRLQPLK